MCVYFAVEYTIDKTKQTVKQPAVLYMYNAIDKVKQTEEQQSI